MKNVINTKEGSNEETKVEKLDGTHEKDKYGRLKPTHILAFSSFSFMELSVAFFTCICVSCLIYDLISYTHFKISSS